MAGALELCGQPRPEGPVHVDHRAGAGGQELGEEAALGLEVALEIAVEVEVIAGEVREAGRGERQPGHALLGERDRGHLHHAMPNASADHLLEGREELGGLGGGEGGRVQGTCHAHPEGADEAGQLAGALDHRGHQQGGGGLAVGAGHPAEHELPIGVAEEPARGERQAAAGVGHDQGIDAGDGRLRDHRHRPPRQRLGGEARAVLALARERKEQIPRARRRESSARPRTSRRQRLRTCGRETPRPARPGSWRRARRSSRAVPMAAPGRRGLWSALPALASVKATT